MSHNSKLKEKYQIKEKIHLATEKKFVLIIPSKLINGSLGSGYSEKTII